MDIFNSIKLFSMFQGIEHVTLFSFYTSFHKKKFGINFNISKLHAKSTKFCTIQIFPPETVGDTSKILLTWFFKLHTQPRSFSKLCCSNVLHYSHLSTHKHTHSFLQHRTGGEGEGEGSGGGGMRGGASG